MTVDRSPVLVQTPAQNYEHGTRLRHYSGALWEVIETDLPGDGETWSEGMVLCEGDYLIQGVGASGAATGRTMRVHADYLHGDGWRVEQDNRAMSDQYGKGDRSPDLTQGDLTRGLHALQTEADRGSPSARAVLAELARLKAALDLIPRDARSKHGTHYWTGRNWKELP